MIDPSLLAPPAPGPNVLSSAAFEAIATRERVSDRYWTHKDTILAERLWWRAQTARHMFHILPGETVLELGCGTGAQTKAIHSVTRGECPITAATFMPGNDLHTLREACPAVEVVNLTGFPGELTGRQFDYVIGGNLLDQRHAAGLLQEVLKLLKPGGRLLLFETNPWNPVLQIRKALGRLLPFLKRGDERALHNQVQLYELLSEVGFISIAASCYDFLYPPIPRWLMMPARNLTLLMENTPGVRNFAGTVLLHAQKGPRATHRPAVSMTEHASLKGAISVVVPCYNEEMNVGPLADGLLRHYDEYLHEIILVDDNSKDRTRQVMESLAAADPRVRPVFRKPPNGVGRALADGMRAATGRYVLLMDCDFLHILPELREMFDAAAAGADVVLGSRFSRDSVLINYPLQKILCNRSFHVLLNLLFRRRVRDLTNNLKLMRREVVENLDLEAAWFAANAETGLKPLLMGYKVQGVPISWINRTPEMGQSSFSLVKNGIGYAKVLGSLAWQTRFGTRLLPRKSDSRPVPVSAENAEAPSPVVVGVGQGPASPEVGDG
ncbi:MAG: glycosyl transferase family 2 [Planctomycetota bacterium]|nr:glycosyl transferase family 2 [Planctomycetota bacterium]